MSAQQRAQQIGAMREQCFDSATLSALARKQSTVPLRRAGALIELTIVGVAACLAGQPDARTAVLWGSRFGIRTAGERVVTDIVIAREMPFPFDFLATQPIVAAIPLQKSFPCIENVLYQPWGVRNQESGVRDQESGVRDQKSNAALLRRHISPIPENWQRMRALAVAWLRAGRYARVLCGQVEPGKNTHRGWWQVLESAPLPPRGGEGIVREINLIPDS